MNSYEASNKKQAASNKHQEASNQNERIQMRKLFTLFLIIISASNILASLPTIKNYSKQKDLIDGDAEKISISSTGILSLSPQVKKIFDGNQPFIWDLVADSKGNLFAATGDGAKVIRITANGKVDSIAHWSDSEVYALAIDNNGLLYAAISPDGKIYRFNKNQKPELFAELKTKYIWDIIFDAKNNCYVATGDSGAIYKIDADGKKTTFFKSDETHIRCLSWDHEKNLLAGSFKIGYIFSINPSGKGIIVYDSNFEEISQIQTTFDGTIYAVAMNSTKKSSLSNQTSDKSSAMKSTLKSEDFMAIVSTPVGRKTAGNSGLLKIQPNGVIKNLWDKMDENVHSICLVKDGVLVGSGEQGRLYKIANDKKRTLLLKLSESQIVSLLKKPTGEIWLGASNLSAVYKLNSKFEKSGTYISPVIDAVSKTKWGTIQWEEKLNPGDKVQFYTRTGNTKKPNSTWNSWKKASGGKNPGIIKSKEARFMQWKVELKSKKPQTSPEIKKIKVSYLRLNLPPEISSITVHPIQRKSTYRQTTPMPLDYPSISVSVQPGGVDQLPKETIRPQPYRRSLTNGYRRVSWRARDENKDQLIYSLYFRFKNDKNWLLLKKDLTRSSHTWDSRSMPDGNYQLKLIASDEKSNPLNATLSAEKISDRFIIDNSAPEIKNISLNKSGADSLQVSFTVRDDLSAIKKVEFSLNAQKWNWVYPKDQVCDTKEEMFSFRIKKPQPDYRIIVIKATDKSENTGYGRVKLVKD
ncbi:hypothetical protein H8E88_33860 [candidate division KSB1 bacterium]|nr:hypothetical protein [candidate division KSB1 bacterium]